MRKLVVILAALALLLTLAGPAAAKKYKDKDGGTIEVTGSIQYTDKNGKPTGPKETLEPAAVTIDGQPATPISSRVPMRMANHAPQQGCADVSGTILRNSALGWRIWQFWQKAHYCWNQPTITGIWRSADGKGSNGWSYDGLVATTAGLYYTWCCGNPKSGHQRWMRGGFHIGGAAYVQTNYPWVRLYLQGNGHAWYTAGT